MKPHISQTRHAYALRFSDDEAQQKYAAEVEKFRAEMPYRYGVGPGVSFTTPSGRSVQQRQQVTLADFRGGELPPYRLLGDAILRGSIIESHRVFEDDRESGGDAA